MEIHLAFIQRVQECVTKAFITIFEELGGAS